MRGTTYIAFILVFLVVLAGSVVRMTGSGMGCPDWPKCFGLLIPPTSEDQVKWTPNFEYQEGQMVIENDTLWQAQTTHVSSGDSFSSSEFWAHYTKHDYAEFNSFHTWVEYINRLLGALSGIPILLLFILSITSEKVVPIVLASGALLSVLFVSWLGKLVVDGNLIPFSVTIHAVCALGILAFLVGMMQYLKADQFAISDALEGLIITSFSLAFLQLVLGTQVREQVDVLLEQGITRPEILDSLPTWWKIHRTAVWPLILIHLAWAVPLLKVSELRKYAGLTIGIILTLATTGFLFVKLGFPAFIQPAHILLAFGLILVDLRVLLAIQIHRRKDP